MTDHTDNTAEPSAAVLNPVKLIGLMQDASANYLEPIAYERHCPGGTGQTDKRDDMFINDIIYFLDSEEHGTNKRYPSDTVATVTTRVAERIAINLALAGYSAAEEYLLTDYMAEEIACALTGDTDQ